MHAAAVPNMDFPIIRKKRLLLTLPLFMLVISSYILLRSMNFDKMLGCINVSSLNRFIIVKMFTKVNS